MSSNFAGENVRVEYCWCCNEYPKACDTTTFGFVYYCDNRNCCECEDVEPMTLERWNRRNATLSKRTAAIPPRPWLRAEEVRESGSYWWVNDASYATPVTVYVMKSGTDESCFASAGQLGWWKAMQLKELGGLWQRIPEPELPQEKS